MSDLPSRRNVAFSVEIQDIGKRFVQVIDRISVDDIFTHMAQMEAYRLMVGASEDTAPEVNPDFIEFVVSDNLVTR